MSDNSKPRYTVEADEESGMVFVLDSGRAIADIYHDGQDDIETAALIAGALNAPATSSDVTISRETLETLDIMTCLGKQGLETSWSLDNEDRVTKATNELTAALEKASATVVMDGQAFSFTGDAARAINQLKAEIARKRSKSQNSSMWLWLTQVATILNDAGIDMVLFLEMIEADDTKIPATKDSLKLRFWDKIQEHMTGKESSTDLDTKQPDMIYQTACKVLAEVFHIVPPPWPSHTREDTRQ